MGKGYNKKIKRGRKIYTSRFDRVSPGAVILTVVIIGALFAAGWVLYTPIYNMITGEYKFEKSTQDTPPVTEQDLEEENISTEPIEKEEEVPKQEVSGVKAYYIPKTVVASKSQLQSELNKIDKTIVNAVMIDIKTDNGMILYDTSNQLAKTGKAVATNPFNLAEVAKTIKDKGFTPVARISAFKDPIAKQIDYDMVVKYNNTDISWLDKAPEYGGKSWINPYSSAGQNYINGIVKEAVEAGFEKIVVTNIQFPNGYSLETATYPESAGKTKQKALGEFVTKVKATAKASGAEVYVYIEAPKALGMDTIIYDGNPLNFAGDNIVLGVMPSLLGNKFKNEALSINNPVVTPYKTVKSLLNIIKADSNKDIIPMIQGYTAEEYKGSENYAVYGEKEINEQLRAVKDSDIESYIIYKP